MHFFNSIWKNLHLTGNFYTGTACGACDKCHRKELFVNGLYGVAECWTYNHRVDWKVSWTAYRTFCPRGLPCDLSMMWKNVKIQTTGSTASIMTLHTCKMLISNVCDAFWQIFWQIWPVFSTEFSYDFYTIFFTELSTEYSDKWFVSW